MTEPTTDPLAALPPELVAEVQKDPLTLLRAAHESGPGWSTRYGGPEGVAALAEVARQAIERDARDLAALRRVAIAELCRSRSLADIGRAFGISRNAVYKLNREVERQPHELDRLLQEGTW